MKLETLTEVLAAREARCADVWDALWRSESIGRIAVCVGPSEHELARARYGIAAINLHEPKRHPPGWTPKWETALRENLAQMLALAKAPGDGCPLLSVPRFVHQQSQGICDLFGARVEEQPDGKVFAHPLDITPDEAASLTPHPIEESRYYNAVEWIRYARKATDRRVPLRMPVMTGPIDTASYLLGPERTMEWVHAEPDALHALLDTITDVIEAMIRRIREAAGGVIHSHHFRCTRGGFDLCSEVRSLMSRESYETFEAPRLQRLGEALGPYGVHACGSWERTVPSALADPDLRVMNGQVRENDLATLCELAGGELTLSIGPSVNLGEEFTWQERADYYTHLLQTVPPDQPLETQVPERHVLTWNDLCRKHGRLDCRI